MQGVIGDSKDLAGAEDTAGVKGTRGVKGTTGAVIEAETEAAATKNGGRDARVSNR